MIGYVWANRMALGVVLLAAVGGPAWAQDGAGKPLTYDVVSVKPHKAGDNMIRIMYSSDRFLATGASFTSLLNTAYGLKAEQQISGVPGAIADARFDIEAKMDDETVAALKKLSKEESNEKRQAMMRALLADRFQLKIHHETKELPMYSLVIAKGGFKLKEADPNNAYEKGIKGPDGTSRAGMIMVRPGSITAQAVEIAGLAGNLTHQVERIVIDKTGLTGKYDIDLKWTPEDRRADAQDSGTAATAGPSLFTALQEQLGLKLESTKGAVDMIVVDHVEMPSEN